jgi:hypothetical protein
VHAVSGSTNRQLVPSVVSGGPLPCGVISIAALVDAIRLNCVGGTIKES